MDTAGTEELHKVLAAGGSLVDGFLVHNDAWDVFLNRGSGKKEFSVSLAIFDVILDLDWGESLSNGAGRFVSSKDTLTRMSDLARDSN